MKFVLYVYLFEVMIKFIVFGLKENIIVIMFIEILFIYYGFIFKIFKCV